MDSISTASEPTKTALENSVGWFLADKMQDPNTPIATKKYLTADNVLIYLTHCNIAEVSVPRVKVQVFNRVKGGIREDGYQLFSDHRFVKYVNEMIFGDEQGTQAGNEMEPVSEEEAGKVLALVNSLQTARQTL